MYIKWVVRIFAPVRNLQVAESKFQLTKTFLTDENAFPCNLSNESRALFNYIPTAERWTIIEPEIFLNRPTTLFSASANVAICFNDGLLCFIMNSLSVSSYEKIIHPKGLHNFWRNFLFYFSTISEQSIIISLLQHMISIALIHAAR